jgi:hypothetical protein
MSWMSAIGLLSLASAANQVVIELFRRGQVNKGGVGGVNSPTLPEAAHEPLVPGDWPNG